MIPAAQQIKNADTADLNQSIGEKSSTAVLPENLPDETVYRDPVSLKKPTLQKGISLQENSAENTVRYERVSPVGYTAAGSGDEQNDTLSLPTLAEFSGGFPHNEPVSFHPGPAFQAEKNSTGEVTDFSSRNEPVSFHPGPISQAERNKVADSSGQDVFLRRESRPAEESGERYASSQLGVAVGALTDCARAQLRYLRKNYELL